MVTIVAIKDRTYNSFGFLQNVPQKRDKNECSPKLASNLDA